MKLFKLLTVLFLASMFFGGCAGMQLKKEVASVPDGHMRVSIINNTDVVMCHNTAWLNHNYGDEREELEEKYRSRVISEIPEGTAIIKIYHKHYKAIPR